jgi:hypothetical protein
MQSRTTATYRLTLSLLPFFALVVVYVMFAVRPLHATLPGTNGQIEFVQGDPNANLPTATLFRANPDGTRQPQVPLGDSIEFATRIVWSPDGTKLLIDHTIQVRQRRSFLSPVSACHR